MSNGIVYQTDLAGLTPRSRGKSGISIPSMIRTLSLPQIRYRHSERPRESFDKQYVWDYLLTLAWGRRSSGPELPPEVLRGTGEKYRDALRDLTGEDI